MIADSTGFNGYYFDAALGKWFNGTYWEEIGDNWVVGRDGRYYNTDTGRWYDYPYLEGIRTVWESRVGAKMTSRVSLPLTAFMPALFVLMLRLLDPVTGKVSIGIQDLQVTANANGSVTVAADSVIRDLYLVALTKDAGHCRHRRCTSRPDQRPRCQ